jgi:DNA-binding response OmpR family regulator
MRSVRDRAQEQLRVTIVSANPETLDGLQTYLRQAGIHARGTGEIESGAAMDPHPSAVVFFPDEFPAGNVLKEVTRLRRERPQVLIVLVTREAKKFTETLATNERAPTIVVPKPVWGWAILDAIRGHLETP